MASEETPVFDSDESKSTAEGLTTTTNVLELWKKTVDVQQHFNTLAMQIRNYALTLVAAGLGAAGYALKEGFHLTLPIVHDVPLGTCLAFVVAWSWLAFFLMDYMWYHQFLVGSVKHGRHLEGKLQELGLPAGLTVAISDSSKFKLCGKEIGSRGKMFAFYGMIFLLLIVIAIGSYWARPVEKKEEAIQKVEILSLPKSSNARDQIMDWPHVSVLNSQSNPLVQIPAAIPDQK